MATYSSRSLNQIITEFQTIANNHRFIHSFACGTFDDFATSGDTKYPAMWMQYDGVTVDRKTQNLSFKILVCDRVKKDRTNLQEILSDTLRTLHDFRIQIEQPAYGWEVNFGNATPVYEEYMEDEIAGWESTFDLTQPFVNDVCAIPYIVQPTPTNGWTGGTGSTTWPDYVPTSRTLTINGVSYDLSADRSWTISTGSSLPDQTGNSGKWLTTNGTSASWSALSGNISLFTNDSGYITSSSLTGYVPYTGATGDVNIGTHTFRSQLLYVNASSVNDPLGNVTVWTSEQSAYRTQHFNNIFWFTEFGGASPVQTLHAITSQTSLSMGTYSNHPVNIRVNNLDGWTFGTNGYMRYSNNTASRVAVFDSSKDLVSSSITDTELGYLSGATSNIQNQINNLMIGVGGWKAAARVLVSSNVTISSPGASLDGVAMSSGDRVVLNGQSTGSQNGVYVWNGAASAMTRATDCSTGDSSNTGILGMVITIEEGTYADQMWMLTNNGPITIGATSLSYSKTSATTYTGSTGVTLVGNDFRIDNTWFSGDVTVGATGITAIGAGKVTNTMIASMTSANLATIISDETGTGSLVFASAPTLTNPVVGTQSAGDNSTKAASTAYVDTKKDYFTLQSVASAFSPVDSTTYYAWGSNSPGTTANQRQFNGGFAFKIIGAVVIVSGNSTAGTSENITLQIRNITQATSTSVGTFQSNGGSSTVEASFTFTGLNISVAASDFISVQFDTPNWSTNPIGTVWRTTLICSVNS